LDQLFDLAGASPASSSSVGSGMTQPVPTTRIWFLVYNVIQCSILLAKHLALLKKYNGPQKWDPTLERSKVTPPLQRMKTILQSLASRSKVAREGLEALMTRSGYTPSLWNKGKASGDLINTSSPARADTMRGIVNLQSRDDAPLIQDHFQPIANDVSHWPHIIDSTSRPMQDLFNPTSQADLDSPDDFWELLAWLDTSMYNNETTQ
jgi:hypothetical protein